MRPHKQEEHHDIAEAQTQQESAMTISETDAWDDVSGVKLHADKVHEARRDEIELFHEVLTRISMCQETQSVRDFIVAAYVRGASIGSAEHTPLEGNKF